MIDFRPLCPPAEPRGRARSRRQRQLHFVDHDQQVRRVDLEVARQPADRLAARVHERQRLGQQHADRRARRHFAISASTGAASNSTPAAPRQLVDDREPDVVPRPLVLARPGLPARRSLQSSQLLLVVFFFSSFSSRLPRPSCPS